MRILLSAYACCPGRGSEPGLGWNWARMLAERFDVHVITAAWSRERIEAELVREPRPRLRFSYVPDFFRNTNAWPLGLGWLHYYLWQWRAYRLARRLHAKEQFDLAHHVTYATWRTPSFLWKLGIPFVWGPIGGGQDSPPGFLKVLGWRGAAKELVRRLGQHLSRWDPFVRATLRRARIILAANTATLEFLPRKHRGKTRQMLETAIKIDRDRPLAAVRENPRPCEILWVGYMEPRKALPLLLGAMSRIEDSERFHLSVIGHGPEKGRWQALSRRLGIEGRVDFLGRLPYAEVQERYRKADIFVFTSIRDTSGNVLLEAMSVGLPVVCLDWAGPADITTDACAIRIRPRGIEQVTNDLASALEQLAGNADTRRRLGRAGHEHVASEFSWKHKLALIERLYAEVLKEKTG